MAEEIDKLFEKEQDISSHLKELGIILLDISDSTKQKLSRDDMAQVKELLTTFAMHCEAMCEDITSGEATLKTIRAKRVAFKDSALDTKELKQHLSEVKAAVKNLKENATLFLAAKNRELVFQEMNKDYSEVLGSLTELMAKSV